MKKHLFLFVIFILSCTDQKVRLKSRVFIPFVNVPHTQYLNLQGTVSEMQIKAYSCNITDFGYEEPKSVNLQHCLYPNCNPCFSFMFQDHVSSYKDDIDIYFQPIESIKEMFDKNFDMTELSYSFNKNGFITSVSSYNRDKEIGSVKIKYNIDNVVNNVYYNLPSIDIQSIGGKRVMSQNTGTLVNKDFLFNSDTIRLVRKNISSKKDTSISIHKYTYVNRGDFFFGISCF